MIHLLNSNNLLQWLSKKMISNQFNNNNNNHNHNLEISKEEPMSLKLLKLFSSRNRPRLELCLEIKTRKIRRTRQPNLREKNEFDK